MLLHQRQGPVSLMDLLQLKLYVNAPSADEIWLADLYCTEPMTSNHEHSRLTIYRLRPIAPNGR